MTDSTQSPSSTPSPSQSLEEILSELEKKFSSSIQSAPDSPNETSNPSSWDKVSKKKVLTGLTLLLIVSGSVAGFYLTQVDQEIREQAKTPEIVEVTNPNTAEDSVQTIDPQTQRKISSLTNGSTLHLKRTPQNIQITFAKSSVKSTIVTLTGPTSKTLTLNTEPFILDEKMLDLPAGSYTLKATGYSQSNGQGLPMSELTVSFDVASD